MGLTHYDPGRVDVFVIYLLKKNLKRTYEIDPAAVLSSDQNPSSFKLKTGKEAYSHKIKKKIY